MAFDRLIGRAGTAGASGRRGPAATLYPAHLDRGLATMSKFALCALEVGYHTEAARLEGLPRADWYRLQANERALGLFTSTGLRIIVSRVVQEQRAAASLSAARKRAEIARRTKAAGKKRWDAEREEGGYSARNPLARVLNRRIEASGVPEPASGRGRPRVHYPAHLDRGNGTRFRVLICPLESAMHEESAQLDRQVRANWYRDLANQRALRVLGVKGASRIEDQVVEELERLAAMDDGQRRAHAHERMRAAMSTRWRLAGARGGVD